MLIGAGQETICSQLLSSDPAAYYIAQLSSCYPTGLVGTGLSGGVTQHQRILSMAKHQTGLLLSLRWKTNCAIARQLSGSLVPNAIGTNALHRRSSSGAWRTDSNGKTEMFTNADPLT